MNVGDRIDLLNAQVRLVVTVLLVIGVLYALVAQLIEGNVFVQMAGIVLAFWFGQRPPTQAAPPTQTTVVTPAATATMTTGEAKP